VFIYFFCNLVVIWEVMSLCKFFIDHLYGKQFIHRGNKYILRFMVSLMGVFLVMTKITFVPVERDFSVNIDL